MWQPLLAMASWIEAHGAKGLLGLLQEHALATIDAGKDDATPDHDETLLRILAEKRTSLEMPQPKEILEAAKEYEPDGFRWWSAKGVANALRRYGITTNTYAGRKVYGKVELADLARIQATYGMTLGVQETDPE